MDGIQGDLGTRLRASRIEESAYLRTAPRTDGRNTDVAPQDGNGGNEGNFPPPCCSKVEQAKMPGREDGGMIVRMSRPIAGPG